VTTHIVCRDCEFEALEDDPDEVDRIIDTHKDETGHDVDDDRVDDGAKLVTDGGQALIPAEQYEHIADARDALRKVDGQEIPDDVAEFVEDAYGKFDWWHDRVEHDPDLVTDGGAEYDDPLEAVDGETEVEIECAVGIHAPRDCDGWCETVELDEPADYTGQFLKLPGFNWECPECGNPNEFEVEGIRVSNLV